MTAAFRWRTEFRKAGRLRLLSHLELARALERSVRRAGLPYAVTQGFSPRMRIAFGPALPVGTGGLAELFDLWLTDFVPPGEALERLRAATPEDLGPSGGVFVAAERPSLSSAITAATYEIRLGGLGEQVAAVRGAIAELVSRPAIEVPHKGGTRTFDPRAEVLDRPVVESREGDAIALLALRLGPNGALRPDALVAAALRYSGVRTAGEPVVTRTGLLEQRDGALRDPLD